MQFSIMSEFREHDASYESVVRCKVTQALAKYSRQFRKSSMRIYHSQDSANVSCLMVLTPTKGEELKIEESAPSDSEAVSRALKAAAAEAKAYVARVATNAKQPKSSIWSNL